MKTIKKEQVFYSVKGSAVKGADLLSRGIFDKLAEALVQYKCFPDAEVWRHLDENGERVSNLKIYDSKLRKNR